MSSIARVQLAEFPVDLGTRQQLFEAILARAEKRIPSYVCLLNVHMFIEAAKKNEFKKVLEQADLVLADGMPIVNALCLLNGVRQSRMAGMDIIGPLIAEAARREVPVFFYGSTQEVLKRMIERARQENPGFILAGYHAPPFGQNPSGQQQGDVAMIKASKAGLVLVALGCPKQEIWMARHKADVQAVMIGLGGAFPVYAGIQSRAPLWVQKLSLEWLFRLLQEPRRLWRRYLITNSWFCGIMAKELLRKVLRLR